LPLSAPLARLASFLPESRVCGHGAGACRTHESRDGWSCAQTVTRADQGAAWHQHNQSWHAARTADCHPRVCRLDGCVGPGSSRRTWLPMRMNRHRPVSCTRWAWSIVAAGWVACAGLRGKGQETVFHTLQRLQVDLPFRILGLETDNGTEFIKRAILDYCTDHRHRLYRCRGQTL